MARRRGGVNVRLWVAASVLLVSCGGQRRDPSPWLPSEALTCLPYATGTGLEVCDGPLEALGRSRHTPFEWGSAGRGKLWAGLLQCPGGALATVVEGGELPGDVRRVEVSCPTMPTETWFVTSERCGRACLPQGYTVVPYAAAAEMTAARDAGDVGALGELRTIHGEGEFIWQMTAAASLATGDLDGFLEAMLGMDDLRPLQSDEVGALGRVAAELDAPSALAALRRGYAGVAAEGAVDAWATCGMGLAEWTVGDAEAGQAWMTRACLEGDAACCARAATSWDEGPRARE